MSKSRDNNEIKLFGRTITSLSPVNHLDQSKDDSSSSSSSSCSHSLQQQDPTVLANKNDEDKSRFKEDPYMLSDLNEPPKASREISSPRSSKNNVDQQSSEITTTSSGEDKATVLKKPDKILPCPRCESANTKFCYYNNYNVNQPRYFCRNCQRYWTAGGSMRSVPVGSGRRKNKGWPSSNPYLHLTSDDFDNNNSRTILSFGSSESTVTETGKHQSVDTKVTTSDTASQEHKTHQGFLPPQVMYPNSNPPWPYQWSPNANIYPIPFYWGCTVPLWPPPTLETSPSLGKRSRDQTQGEGEATKSAVLPKEPKKRTQGFSMFNGFDTKGGNNRSSLVSETSLSLQVNPAAMSRSMNFRESMQL